MENNENEQLDVQNGGNVEASTPDADTEKTEPSVDSAEKQVNKETKSFTQEQVNDIVRDRIERERKSFYKDYGVEDKKGLDGIIEKAKLYENTLKEHDELKTRFDKQSLYLADTLEKLAFIENEIAPERYEDVRNHFRGANLEFSSDAVKQLLETHPEWKKIANVSDKPITTIENISPSRGSVEVEDEKKLAAKMFGLNRII